MATTTVGRAYITDPARSAWANLNQFLLTSAATFFSAMFNMQHDILPWWIAIPVAIGFEWTYLRGLAASDTIGKSRWAQALNWAALITSVTYGMLYVLGMYGVISDKPEGITAVSLAAAHILPIGILSFCGANLRRVSRERIIALKQQGEDAAAARKLQDDEHKAELQRQQDAHAIERQQKYLDAKLDAEIKALRRSAKALTDTAPAGVTSSVTAVSHTVPTPNRTELRAAIVTLYKTLGDTLNVSHEAAQLGISRGLWYKLRDEARASGEM
jgi:hypothetical protein